MIYALRNNGTLANLVLDQIGETGQNMRKAYQRRLPSDTSKDYYFIHRNTGVTQPIIVEYGFLDSTEDDVSQLKNNWEDLAESVVDGILEYIGVSAPTPPTGNYYTVKSGDSLWSIAKKFDVTVDELKKANNLTSNTLSIGQVLKIPVEIPATSNQYTVKSGDTLYSIARNYNITVDELKNANNLTTNALSIGQVLTIPSVVSETPNTENYITYTAKTGDNLYAIAKKYGLTMDELMKYNNLNSTLLSIGQILKIPITDEETPSTENYITYTVKSGDNLYAIARNYNTTVNEIMTYNNLKSNLLSVGQVLKIPTSINTTYTVKSGDTLYSIANKYNTTVDQIKSKNNLQSNALSIGQTLII